MEAILLHVPAQHPYPGSITQYENRRWRIRQHVGAEAILDPTGDNRAHSRRAPIAALVDPDAEQLNDAGLSRANARPLKWLNDQLRTANSLLFDELKTTLYAAAMQGQANYVDGPTLASLLRRLGWQREPRHAGQSHGVRIWRRSPAAQA